MNDNRKIGSVVARHTTLFSFLAVGVGCVALGWLVYNLEEGLQRPTSPVQEVTTNAQEEQIKALVQAAYPDLNVGTVEVTYVTPTPQSRPSGDGLGQIGQGKGVTLIKCSEVKDPRCIDNHDLYLVSTLTPPPATPEIQTAPLGDGGMKAYAEFICSRHTDGKIARLKGIQPPLPEFENFHGVWIQALEDAETYMHYPEAGVDPDVSLTLRTLKGHVPLHQSNTGHAGLRGLGMWGYEAKRGKYPGAPEALKRAGCTGLEEW